MFNIVEYIPEKNQLTNWRLISITLRWMPLIRKYIDHVWLPLWSGHDQVFFVNKKTNKAFQSQINRESRWQATSQFSIHSASPFYMMMFNMSSQFVACHWNTPAKQTFLKTVSFQWLSCCMQLQLLRVISNYFDFLPVNYQTSLIYHTVC